MPPANQDEWVDAKTESPSSPESRLHTRMSMIKSLQGFSEKRWLEFELVYRPLLVFFLKKKSVPPDAIDDVLQESLISIMKGIERYERVPGKSFRGWLRTITQRRAADYFRSAPPEKRGVQDYLNVAVSPEQRNPNELAEEEQAMQEVQARAMELVRTQTKEQTWTMFWKSTMEQVPTAEIAAEFGVSTAAVRVAKQRVTKRLKEAMFEA